MLLRFFRNEGRGISMQGRDKQRPYERSEDNSFTAPEAACSIHNRNCLS